MVDLPELEESRVLGELASSFEGDVETHQCGRSGHRSAKAADQGFCSEPGLAELELTFDVEGYGVCTVRGEVTGSTQTTLTACVPFLIYYPAVVLDLSHVSVIDRSGLAALAVVIDALRRSAASVSLKVGPALRKMAEVACCPIDDRLEVRPVV